MNKDFMQDGHDINQKKVKFPQLLREVLYLLSLPILVFGVYIIALKASYPLSYYVILCGNFFLFAYFLIPAIAAVYMKRGPLLEEKSINFNSKTKNFAGILTCIYMLMFPFFCSMSLLSPLVFDSSKTTPLYGSFVIFLFYCMPASLSMSVYLMWIRSKQPSSFSYCAALPVAVFFLLLIL
jgi:hypothetical protein